MSPAGSFALPSAEVAGYILAGGRSSRMGTDKALVPLAGRPLIRHALDKLAAITSSPAILAGPEPGNPALAGLAPLVFDLHPGCGPISGLEAALAHSRHPWSLILPVDLPLLPAGLLAWWAERTLAAPASPVRIALLSDRGVPQPALLLLHRDAAPLITEAIQNGDYKLMRVLESAARSLEEAGRSLEEAARSLADSRSIPSAAPVLQITEVPDPEAHPPQLPRDLEARLHPAELSARSEWFANLNSPRDLASAEDLFRAI